MKRGFYSEYLRPFVVLVAICLIVAALLGAANAVTAPVIEGNARMKMQETRAKVLPGAVGFFEVDPSEFQDVKAVYEETSGHGYVIVSGFKGYGGIVTVTVGVDLTGTVVGIEADVTTETQGVGSKAGLPVFLSRFLGISGSTTVEAVDTISNATYSSSAVKNGVAAALRVYETLTGREAAK